MSKAQLSMALRRCINIRDNNIGTIICWLCHPQKGENSHLFWKERDGGTHLLTDDSSWCFTTLEPEEAFKSLTTLSFHRWKVKTYLQESKDLRSPYSTVDF